MLIPDEYKHATNGELILQFDSGAADARRMLIFAVDQTLDSLASCEHVLADASFDVCLPTTCSTSFVSYKIQVVPKLFYQLLVVMGLKYETTVPMIFCLMSSKTSAEYRKFWSAIKNLRPNIQFSSIVMDFEMAHINEVRFAFPNTSIQVIWRK